MITRTPLRDHAYQHILQLVHRGELAPGARVKDVTLAVQLGVSRTPVREALLQLAREGVLNADIGRGFTVRSLDSTEMREAGAILSALEVLALTSSPEIPGERLSRLGEIDRQLVSIRGDADRIVGLEEEWHHTLLIGCPNQRLRGMISTLWQVPRRYMRAYLRDTGRVTLSTQHHARIVEAERRQDRQTAASRLTHYWTRGIEELGSWMER
ncbi:MAG TPA: GntR family transcriptional regulator [Gemmatimonadales bacterium]|nr:GntR family transcriptional regulator [Gemmatimonadales bacterium]